MRQAPEISIKNSDCYRAVNHAQKGGLEDRAGNRTMMTGDFILSRQFARLLCLCMALALLAPHSAYAQVNGSATLAATAEVAIVPKLGLVEAEGLNFGTMAPGASGGAVVVSPSGVRTLPSGSTVLLAGGTVTGGRFDGYGNRNQQVRIFITATPITIKRVGAPPTPGTLDLMTVSNFILGVNANSGAAIIGAGGGAPRLRISRPNGLFSFNIGATLTVKNGQHGGHYSGNYELTAVYN